MVINIRPAFTQSYVNILSKVSVLTSLAVQWLGLHAFTKSGTGSIPGQGTEIPHTTWRSQKKIQNSETAWLYVKGENV